MINSRKDRNGFTLMEVILVLVLIVVISGVSIPYFAGSYRGTKLRTSARTLTRMANYARSMAILREDTLTIVLDPETMELYLGGAVQVATNAADGELDQEVLKRLGYVDGDDSAKNAGIEKEIHRFLPSGLTVLDFEKNQSEDDDFFEDLYLIRYYPNGQSDWFMLELEDARGLRVKLENDPVSGKVRSELTQ